MSVDTLPLSVVTLHVVVRYKANDLLQNDGCQGACR